MATLDAYFTTFHSRINLDQGRRDQVTSAHTTLRERLRTRPALEAKIKELFLQGSCAQHTAVRPPQEGEFDVDVVLAMDFSEVDAWGFREPRDPRSALDWVARRLRGIPTYAGKVHQRGRCVRIEFSEGFHMDVVPAHAPNGHDKPLWIPNRDLNQWQASHPKGYLDWCTERNKATDGQFSRIVKYMKCWRDDVLPKAARPKSIILQTMVGAALKGPPNSVEQAVTSVLDRLASMARARAGFLSDFRVTNPAMPNEDLAASWEASSIARFAEEANRCAEIARAATQSKAPAQSAQLWSMALGRRFPLTS